MNISEDATWFYIYGHEKPEVLTALDQLDTAAFCLSVEDQERYFEAKYEIHHTLFEESKNRSDSLKLWMQRMAFDQESLLRINLNLKHTLNLLISDIEKYELTKSFPPESISNHFRRIAAVTYVLKVRKTRQHNHKAAIVLARNAVKDIKPEDNLCTDTWYSVSNSTCARCYDQILVKSLCGTLGGDGQLLMEEVCSRYWNNENITKLLLLRFTKPTSNAFDLFRKAGNTDELKNNRIIAWTEMTLWKKAHKFRKFKKEYPERYRLAIKK